MQNDFEKLLNKLSPTIKRIAHKLNGHHSFFDEDDLCQEAIAHLWVAFRKGKLKDKTDSYILQGCFFHLKNHLRKMLDKAKLTSLQQLIDEGDSTLEEFIASDNSRLNEHIEKALIFDSIEKMDLTERETLVLSLSLEGRTVREIGARLGISHVMVLKIRKTLKKKCKALYYKGKEAGYQN